MRTGYHLGRAFAKKLAFALLRAKQPVWLFDATSAASGSRLRVIHVGAASRGKEFVRLLFGTYPTPARLGDRWMRPAPGRGSAAFPHHDLLLTEINRLYAPRYRAGGFVTVPEWVEFGRPIVADAEQRYAGASKSLRCDLAAIRETDYRVVTTTERADFELFREDMYLPHLVERFGDDAIRKPRARLLRDFQHGFLMLVLKGDRALAGAIARVDGDIVSETTFGAPPSVNGMLNVSTSGLIDYHLQQWSADRGKRFLRVGHTHPFPGDGVYFNKRKWQMSIMPDEDGVMDMAVKVQRIASFPLEILESAPFVFSARRGLGVLAVHRSERALDPDETRKQVKRFWTDGLRSMILICPAGFRSGVAAPLDEPRFSGIHLCSDLERALDVYRAQV